LKGWALWQPWPGLYAELFRALLELAVFGHTIVGLCHRWDTGSRATRTRCYRRLSGKLKYRLAGMVWCGSFYALLPLWNAGSVEVILAQRWGALVSLFVASGVGQ
jgi:hypothetical protein